MKKLLVIATLFAGISTTTSFAINDEVKTFTTQDDKKTIEANQLPEAVVNTLGNEAFKGSEIVSIIEEAGDTKVYHITLKKEDNQVVVKIDEKGNILQ